MSTRLNWPFTQKALKKMIRTGTATTITRMPTDMVSSISAAPKPLAKLPFPALIGPPPPFPRLRTSAGP